MTSEPLAPPRDVGDPGLLFAAIDPWSQGLYIYIYIYLSLYIYRYLTRGRRASKASRSGESTLNADTLWLSTTREDGSGSGSWCLWGSTAEGNPASRACKYARLRAHLSPVSPLPLSVLAYIVFIFKCVNDYAGISYVYAHHIMNAMYRCTHSHVHINWSDLIIYTVIRVALQRTIYPSVCTSMS